MAAHQEHRRLGAAAGGDPFRQQVSPVDQAAAAVGPQAAGPQEAAIGPGESLLEGTTVTGSAEASRPTLGWRQPTVEADGQHQPDRHTRAGSA
jgi:hypothetical protein